LAKDDDGSGLLLDNEEMSRSLTKKSAISPQTTSGDNE
jgi:hypothetical protein